MALLPTAVAAPILQFGGTEPIETPEAVSARVVEEAQLVRPCWWSAAAPRDGAVLCAGRCAER